METKILKLPHGFYKGLFTDANMCPTIEGSVERWDILVCERKEMKVPIKNGTKVGYEYAYDGDGIDLGLNRANHRGTVQHGMCQTIKAGMDNGVIEMNDDVRILGNYMPSGHEAGRVIDRDGTCPTIKENHGTVYAVNEFTDTEKKLFTEDGNMYRYIGSDQIDEFKEGQMATTTYPNGYGHGPRTHDESVSLNTVDIPSVKKNFRIRKLTPKECTRLMGFTDDDYRAMTTVNSSSQIYKQCGNSIVVNVLEAIFKEML